MLTEEGFFALPAFPLEDVVDPTGAGDCFAGGFIGYIAAHADAPIGHEVLAPRDGLRHRARLVQRRGVRRRARRSPDPRGDRASASPSSRRVTHFEERPIALRG